MFILRYHEIALKGGNRSFFESRLRDHLKRLFVDLPHVTVRNCHDHFRVEGYAEEEALEVADRIGRVFGVVNFSRVETVPLEEGGLAEANYERVCERGLSMVREFLCARAGKQKTENGKQKTEGVGGANPASVTFRVTVRRRDKSLPLNSMEVAREVSSRLLPSLEGVTVRLTHPDIEWFVEWGKTEALLYVNKQPGAGGLPVGSAGKVVSLLSAGFDSPVASWMMMRRGATVVFAHFHSYPAVGKESIENVKRLVEVLNRWQLRARLYLIPLVEYQKFVVAHAPAPLRVLLYRRMMIRLAERVASRERAKALVTGESLAQVASQTLANLSAVDAVATRPVLRPLIGMDKEEIIERARAIGTAEISVQPYEDCCSLYVPRAPALAASAAELDAAEAALDVARFEDALWEAREVSAGE